jgi:hypothetical protein
VTTSFVDAEGLVADWVNRQTSLVGEGRPLPKGAHLTSRLIGKPWSNRAGTILFIDDGSLAGPVWAPDIDEPRYLVDCDFYVRPA